MDVVILITAANKREAKKIAKGLVGKKLAACVNVVDGVKSFFWWEGKIDSGNEVLLIVKSQKKLLKKIIKAVRDLHSYSVPEVIALPIVGGYDKYLKWIKDSLK